MAVLALLGAILVSTIHGGCSASDSVCGSASAGAMPAMARPEGARALPLRLRGGAMYDEMVLEDDPERFDQSDPMNASPLPHAARAFAQSAREAGHRPLATSPTLTLRTPKHDHVSYYGILFDVRAKCAPFPNRSTQASTIARWAGGAGGWLRAGGRLGSRRAAHARAELAPRAGGERCASRD